MTPHRRDATAAIDALAHDASSACWSDSACRRWATNAGRTPVSVLADPHLRVFRGDVEQTANDDWNSAIQQFFLPAGAFTLTVGSKDAATRITLTPGGYTVHATGLSGGGIAIVELYESPAP
jgi:hypothetical protein